MKNIVTLTFLLSLFVSNNSIADEIDLNKELAERDYDLRIERLESCRHFFNIVSEQRKKQEEKDRYNSLYISSKNISDSLIKKYEQEFGKNYNKLVSQFDNLGKKRSIEMVKTIDRDKTGKNLMKLQLVATTIIKKSNLSTMLTNWQSLE